MSRSAKALLAACAGGLVLVACRHAPPTPTSAGPEIHVPSGCEKSLAGWYRHQQDPAFVYEGQDDGGTLTLTLERTDAPPSDAGWASTRIVVTRTANGFTGATRTIAFNALHQACAVALPTAVTKCDEDGLTLRSAERVAIDPACQPSSAPPTMVDQRLLRTRDAGTVAHTGTASVADAGTSAASDARSATTAADAGTPALTGAQPATHTAGDAGLTDSGT